jgi:small-conductance mechanosensitive channel
MNVYSAVVAVIAILAVVRITQHWLTARRDARAGVESGQHKQELERLESRVRTLERLVTDDHESLARRIDDLK